ncbi:carboxypeptidase regulatory-like domain-containing protein [Metallibacterium scheffleri]|uniref:carboxypeptidase regulatory-like domain-containing protein n=1 Tax=Metallibacterium scheffleri TaxID=993689 RepID=UPI0023F18E3A|nr:carboxypeptidase regulatory-like domain-containing protein [Metallibacterium scheffleri]
MERRARTGSIRGFVAVFALTAAFAAPAHAGAALAAALPAPPSYIASASHQTQVAGFFLDGKDSGQSISLLPLPQGGYAVDLDQFARRIGTLVQAQGPLLVLPTPLGNAQLQTAQAIQHDQHRYFPIAPLAKALGAKITFDEQEFALKTELPWNPGSAAPGAALSAQQVKPDIYAPSLSLSSWHSEAYFTRLGNSDTLSTYTDLGGALGPGFWRMSYYTNPGGQNRLSNYGWILDQGNGRWMLGEDQLALDPLLPYAQLTGAQYAWTNQPGLVYGAAVGADQLVASQLQGGRTVSGGDGPPGGIAELRINGKAIARTAIRLDGTWQFRDVLLRGDERVEVALYQRFGDGTPVRIQQVNVASSAQALPAGTVISYGGVGADGNPLDPAVGTHGLGGFYQLRYGLNQQWTLGSTVQRAGGQDYGIVNAVGGFGSFGTWGMTLGRNGSASAWSVSGNGQSKSVSWSGYAIQRGANYFPGYTAESYDRYATLNWNAQPDLGLSLSGRDAYDPTLDQNVRFLKPGFSWRPYASLGLSAMPDYFGNYAWNASWLPDARDQVSLSRYSGVNQAQWQHSFRDGYSTTLAATHDGYLGTRYSALLSGMWRGPRPILWTAGLLQGRGRFGYLLDAAVEAIPGLSAHLQVQNDPLNAAIPGVGGLLVQFVLVADFAVTPSGLTRGSMGSYAARVGVIAGRVSGELPANVHWSDLAGVPLLVDGRPRGKLDRDGHYLIPNLAPGVYRVQLDAEHMPIDLVPDTAAPWVQVRAGVTTTADFHVSLRLGFAGRVTRDGQPLANVAIEILDAQGKAVKTLSSDQWGYYRVDDLPPGTYTLRADGASRSVTLQRAFLYQQDLAVAPART